MAIDRQVFSATKESLESPDLPLAVDLPSFSRFAGTILQYKTRSNTTLLD